MPGISRNGKASRKMLNLSLKCFLKRFGIWF